MKLIAFVALTILLILTATTVLWWNEMNKLWSHPIVSGIIMVIIASWFIPRRIEMERIKSLRTGFYKDMEFVSGQYEALSSLIVKCAESRTYDSKIGCPIPVEHGNECLPMSRLNQDLALSAAQKAALVDVEGIVKVVNTNLNENIKKLKSDISSDNVAYHADSQMKAAFENVCLILYTLGKIMELKERLVADNSKRNEKLECALQILYPNNKEIRDRLSLWITSERSLMNIVTSEKQPA